jgi:hypothetical protein
MTNKLDLQSDTFITFVQQSLCYPVRLESAFLKQVAQDTILLDLYNY